MKRYFCQNRKACILFSCLVLFGFCTECLAKSVSEAPANIQSILVVKLMAFNRDITEGGDITIYVLNAPKITKALQSAVGRSIGKSMLTNVTDWEILPNIAPKKPAVLYIGKVKKVESVLEYCQTHKILSVTGVPEIGDKGTSLTIGISNKKPYILLNEASVKRESVTLDPKLMKLVHKR